MSKELRASMDKSQFFRFKKLKAELGESTNDGVVVSLMDYYEENPSVDECISILEHEGFTVEEADEDGGDN